jgi:hypothetical protein
MSNKQQTAVEWLAKKTFIPAYLLERAKELEKQQMFEFWNKGIDCTEEGGKSFDQYYNETFNK